jgi:hypothetical protein
MSVEPRRFPPIYGTRPLSMSYRHLLRPMSLMKWLKRFVHPIVAFFFSPFALVPFGWTERELDLASIPGVPDSTLNRPRGGNV